MALPVFPSLPGLAFPMPRLQQFSTIPQDAISGKRIRFPMWTYPIYRYELSFGSGDGGFLRGDAIHAEWQTLLGFIASVQGSAQLWAYSDPNDGAVTLQSFGAGDGLSAGPFQLVRALGGFAEPVFLVNGPPAILIDGVPKTVNVDYTISAYGAVSFTTPPAHGAVLQWTGNFYWPCRFDDDAAHFSYFMLNLWETKSSLKFSTEKLP